MVMLGFSAGVILAATSFSLIVPAIDLSGPIAAVFGIMLGALVLHLIDRFVAHFHPALGAEGPPSKISKVCLFVLSYLSHFNVSKVGMD
jgi:ZIP family zinc transporter